MSSNLHDPNNHVPPVAASDMWDDGDPLPHQTRDPGGVVLPRRRQQSAPAAATGTPPQMELPGLRINVQAAARQAVANAAAVPVKEYGGEVVRLKQAVAEGPFQAEQVIAPQALGVWQDPRKLQGESTHWGTARQHPLRWLLLAGVGVGAVVVAALATHELLLMPKFKPLSESLELVEEAKIEQMQGFELDGPCEENARSLLAAYAMTSSPEAVLPLIRDAQRLTRRLTQDWQPWQVPADWLPARGATWQVSAADGRSYGCLSGRKPNFAPYRAFFVREGEALRIDWEATEGLGEATFAMLARGRGEGGVIRTYTTPENFYSLVFPESEFRSYKLLAADHEHIVWGYVPLDTPAATMLLKAFEAATNDGLPPTEQAMILRLTPPPTGAQKNQWIIGEMLHIDWVLP
ncbi:MAG: hypothetical protein DVB25_07365 [Verrucomicrobia bacterium]|nr:MAG: hypothetical protein DVB25_07365 [Verrucomicrobiota bacterium]